MLAVGVLTGQLRAPQLLLAAWLDNISIGVAAVTSIARSGRSHVRVPAWLRRNVRTRRPAAPRPPASPPPPTASSTPPPTSAPPPKASPSATAPPPPPPGARPSPRNDSPIAGPDEQVSTGLALVFLLVPLAFFTAFQGNVIAVFGSIGRFEPGGADVAGLSGGPVAFALLLAAAAARAVRRIDPDEALGYAFGHVVALHLGIFIGVFAIVASAFAGVLAGGAGPTVFEVVATLALVAWFVVTDRSRWGNRTPS